MDEGGGGGKGSKRIRGQSHPRNSGEEEDRRRWEEYYARRRQEEAERRRRQPQQPSFDAYATLGVKRGASQDEIKQAYKAAMAQCHPDKVQQMSKEIQDVARKQAQEVNRAYEKLRRP